MRILTFMIGFFLSAVLFAQRTEKVKLTVLCTAGQHLPLEQAKILAVEQAKVMAIDSVFGTNVRNEISNIQRAGDGRSVDDFLLVSNVNVRGRWMKDIEAPKIGKITIEDDMYLIPVTVKGVVKEINRASIDCEVKVLCNDTERGDFMDGDYFRLSFTSPVKGYLVVYLVDKEQNAYRALPYFDQEEGAYAVKANKEYIFFSKKHALSKDKPYVEEYIMNTDEPVETDLLYVIFSPNKFSHPSDTYVDDEHTNMLSWKDFQKWLGNAMTNDEDMIGEMPIKITVTNKSK